MRFYHLCTDADPWGPWADDDEDATVHDYDDGEHAHDLNDEVARRIDEPGWDVYAEHGEWPERLVVHRNRIWGVHTHGVSVPRF